MDIIVTELINIFFTKLSEGNYDWIYSIILLIMTMLLFKQYKSNIVESNIEEDLQVIEAIKLYTNTILIIKRFRYKTVDFDFLCIEIHKLLPFASKKLRKLIYQLNENDLHIDDIDKEVKLDFNSLKEMHKQDISKKISSGFFDNVSYAIDKSKIGIILKPITYTAYTILIIIIVIALIITLGKYKPYQIITIFAFLMNILICIITIINIVEIMVEGRFNKEKKNIVFLIILILSSALNFVTTNNIGIYLSSAYLVFYLSYALKKSIKRT